MLKSIKAFLEKKLSVLALVILVIQPVLDVLSYFLGQLGNNAFSTAVRFLLLMAVALLGFTMSGRKKLYFIFYGIAGGFWLLHMLNCFRVGYRSPVQDIANFLRIISFPVFLLSFITFFQKGEGVRKRIYLGFAVNFGEIVLFTLIPWLIGHPVYTYEKIQVGIMGWFGVANAQSAIVVLVVPLTVLWAYRARKYPVFLAAVVLCFSLLFVTGTKLTFYSIFIIAAAFAFLFVLNLKKKSVKYVLPLLAVMALVFLFRGQSPMSVREQMSAYTLGQYDRMVDEGLENSGVDEEIIREVKTGKDFSSTSGSKLEQLRRSLNYIYTDPEVYGNYLRDLHDRFGVYTVMEAYNYTVDTTVLSDSRVRKRTFAKLIWEEKDLATQILGFEYSDMLMGERTYDLENDFPAVFYFCGYLGFGLYLMLFVFLFFLILRAFFRDVTLCVAQRKGKQGNPVLNGLGSFWQGVQRFLTLEMGAVGMTFLLAVIAAQISGNVLRRPNVTVYFAAVSACVYHLTVDLRKKDKPVDLSGGF